MLKHIIALLLVLALCLSAFAGCQAQKPAADPAAAQGEDRAEQTDPAEIETESYVTEPTEPEESEKEPEQEIQPKNVAWNAFDSGLIAFLCRSKYGNDNFAVSPLSFRAALALAALGAEGETLDQLLQALGYTDREALNAWYLTVLQGVDDFDDYFESARILDRGDAAYQVVNSIWNNEDLPGEFRSSYIEAAEEQFRAAVRSAAADKLADAVNEWVNEQTNGLIPALLSDASDASAILVNALYLKAGWEENFQNLGNDVFTTADGETVEKEYIRSLSEYAYYEDENCQLVAVTLQGGVRMVFVLGDTDGIAEKLAKAAVQRVEVFVPMFDVETSLDKHELMNYLKSLGCERMFVRDEAQFDPMFTQELYVGDIVQKAKVTIDEEGLEAAAATAIVMYGNTAMPSSDPKVFRADSPFSFYVVNGSETPELLFYGQINH